MSNDDSSNLTREMESTIGHVKDCLEQMRHCFEDPPFHIASEMTSIMDVTEDCIGQMRDCCALAEELERLRLYEREGTVTKIMLILTAYGSKHDFQNAVNDAMTTFGDELKKLGRHIEEVGSMLRKKSYKCPQCHGMGNVLKYVYIRERGMPTQQIPRSLRCDVCNGKGSVSITIATQDLLDTFLEKANELFETIENFHKLLHRFNRKAFRST